MFTFSEILRYLLVPIFDEFLDYKYYEQIINEQNLFTHRFHFTNDLFHESNIKQLITNILNDFFGLEGLEWQLSMTLNLLDIQLSYENPIDLNGWITTNYHQYINDIDLNQVPDSLVIKFHNLLGQEEFLKLYHSNRQIAPSYLYSPNQIPTIEQIEQTYVGETPTIEQIPIEQTYIEQTYLGETPIVEEIKEAENNPFDDDMLLDKMKGLCIINY